MIQRFLLFSGAFVCGLPVAAAQDTVASPQQQTFAIETYVARTYNYLDNMVDKDGLPYFNIVWTDPAEAAHDWPDFGDVMSRQLQAAIMARHLTGKEARNEKLWRSKILSYLDPETGLLMRPKTSFSEPVEQILPEHAAPDLFRQRLVRRRDPHGQVLAEFEQPGGVQSATAAEPLHAAQHGHSGDAAFFTCLHDGALQGLAVPLVRAVDVDRHQFRRNRASATAWPPSDLQRCRSLFGTLVIHHGTTPTP